MLGGEYLQGVLINTKKTISINHKATLKMGLIQIIELSQHKRKFT